MYILNDTKWGVEKLFELAKNESVATATRIEAHKALAEAHMKGGICADDNTSFRKLVSCALALAKLQPKYGVQVARQLYEFYQELDDSDMDKITYASAGLKILAYDPQFKPAVMYVMNKLYAELEITDYHKAKALIKVCKAVESDKADLLLIKFAYKFKLVERGVNLLAFNVLEGGLEALMDRNEAKLAAAA